MQLQRHSWQFFLCALEWKWITQKKSYGMSQENHTQELVYSGYILLYETLTIQEAMNSNSSINMAIRMVAITLAV